jgi:hypothetical protein
MTDQHITTLAGISVGLPAVTFPAWSDTVAAISGVNQWLIAIGGLVVLILTIRKLLLENKIASRRLRDMDKER